MKIWVSGLVFGLSFFLTQSASAFNAKGIDWGKFTTTFALQGQLLQGQATRTVTWKETFCEGQQITIVNVKGKMLQPTLDVQEDGSMKVYAQLTQIVLPIEHSYRSEIFLCEALGARYTPTADWADLHASVTFKDNGNQPPSVTVKVIDSQVGRIHFGTGLGDEFEYYLTTLVNTELKKVWASSLGTKITEFLGQEIQHQIGKQ
jgi:hypothetical protein